MAKSLFSLHACVDEEQHTELLSLEGFSALSAKNGLFVQKSQQKFLKHDTSPTQLAPRATELALLLRARFALSGALSPKWEARLLELSRRMSGGKYSHRSVWISYRMLAEYSTALVKRKELERLFPMQFVGIICLAIPVVGRGPRPALGAHIN